MDALVDLVDKVCNEEIEVSLGRVTVAERLQYPREGYAS